MPKDTHRAARTDHTQLALPEQVEFAVAELAGAAREGLLALAVWPLTSPGWSVPRAATTPTAPPCGTAANPAR